MQRSPTGQFPPHPTPPRPRQLSHNDPNSIDPVTGSVSEPITLGCIALDDGRSKLLLVCADMIGIKTEVAQGLYELLDREVGVGFPNVLLSCSHTHFAPGLMIAASEPIPEGNEPDPRFIEDFETKLVEVAKESLRKMVPATMETARPLATALSVNRRWRNADQVVPTPSHVLGRISPIFSPFFSRVLRVFTVSTRRF